MSALPPKADIGTQSVNVRFVPKRTFRAAAILTARTRCSREASLGVCQKKCPRELRLAILNLNLDYGGVSRS
jgi:hypothetical protein